MQDYKMLFQRSLQPLIGQKLVELFQAMPHHSSTDILKIDPGVDVQSTAGLRQRQQCRCRLSAFFTSYEEPVLPSDGKGSDGPFDWINDYFSQKFPAYFFGFNPF